MSERIPLQLSDIWTEEIANKAVSPKIDGGNDWGSIELVEDDNMSSDPNNLKYRTYDFLDRIKITSYQGLIANYNGAYYFTALQTLVLIPPGSVAVEPSTNGFIFISDLGVVTASTVLPGVADLLAYYSANSSSITFLQDARLQAINRAQITNVQSSAIGFNTGDIKITLNPIVEDGWYIVQNQLLNTSVDADLFNIFGYKFGGSGSAFRLPNPVDCVIGFAGNSTELGNVVGSNDVVLNLANMPRHNHPTNGGVHSHSTDGGIHDHTINQTPHDHAVGDPGHGHVALAHRGAALNADVNDGSGAEVSTQGQGNFMRIASSTTGIDVQPANVPISINSSSANVTVNASSANVTIGDVGENAAFSVKNKRMLTYVLIKR